MTILFLQACSNTRQISKLADAIILKDTAASAGFTGISIYEPAANKYWYNYNADRYFTPASNTKLFTLYAGMKCLGDSLVTARIMEDDDTAYLFPNGDPSFLSPEFPSQPLLSLLKKINKSITIVDTVWKENALGPGWAWDDYNDDYMAERSLMPVSGNVVTVRGIRNSLRVQPNFFRSHFITDSAVNPDGFVSFIRREKENNIFHIGFSATKEEVFTVPFITNKGKATHNILQDETGLPVSYSNQFRPKEKRKKAYTVCSMHKDSLFRIMMHRSDNFFAEQVLLMAGNERLGYMNDDALIGNLLKTDLADVPQKPRWVDGSGLSRYNLFTPHSFIYILNKLMGEFGMDRIRGILPTGGQGTLKSYFKNDSSFIYAKTGTLSNNSALSGFLVTNKGKSLIFCILVNHYQTGATPIRKAMERFLESIRKKY